MPEELAESAIAQKDVPLRRMAEDYRACWELTSFHEDLTIRYEKNGEAQELKIALKVPRIPLFKLEGHNHNRGRLVQSPSRGYYLSIVPNSWERDEKHSGPAIANPEPVHMTGYTAHYFFLDNEFKTVAFLKSDNEAEIIRARGTQFDLQGKVLENDHPFMGPLFGGAPPTIVVKEWKDKYPINTIVLGEEGPGRDRWREHFTPSAGAQAIDFPPELLEMLHRKKAGWFFIRIYDEDQELMESLDFRFVKGLKDIEISPESPIPPPSGHGDGEIRFVHDPDCVTVPQSIHDKGLTKIPTIYGTRFIIPPTPWADKTNWRIGYDEAMVEATIVLGRIWWALSDPREEPKWESKPVNLALEHFRATSDKEIVLKFPQERWIEKVKVGLADQGSQEFRVKVTADKLNIPLRGFGDSSQLQKVGKHPLYAFLFQHNNKITIKIGEIAVKLCCKVCGSAFFSFNDIMLHFKEKHLESFFEELSYDEMRMEVPSLPIKIYKCSYCNFYVESHDYITPTSGIISHQTHQCRDVDRSMGCTRILFSVVDDLDEIRQMVIRNLPHIIKCRMCRIRFINPDINEQVKHFRDIHAKSLSTVC